MCRILSIIGQPPKAELNQILNAFCELAERGKVPPTITPGHKDGWGILAYQKSKPVVYRRGLLSAADDVNYEKTVAEIAKHKFDIVICHLRKGTVGEKTVENCHPFLQKNFSFCQNGTIYESDLIPLNEKYKKSLKGQTDSEKLFFLILQKHFEIKKDFNAAIRAAIKEIKENFNYTAMNLFFSDGNKLFALREINTKFEKFKELKLMNYYSLYLGVNKKNNYKIVASEKIKLAGVVWKIIKNGDLIEL